MAKDQMPKDPMIDALIAKCDPCLDSLSHYVAQMAIRWVKIDPRIRNVPIENAIAFFVTALATTVNDKAVQNLLIHEDLMREFGDIDPDRVIKALELMRIVAAGEEVLDIRSGNVYDAPTTKQ